MTIVGLAAVRAVPEPQAYAGLAALPGLTSAGRLLDRAERRGAVRSPVDCRPPPGYVSSL